MEAASRNNYPKQNGKGTERNVAREFFAKVRDYSAAVGSVEMFQNMQSGLRELAMNLNNPEEMGIFLENLNRLNPSEAVSLIVRISKINSPKAACRLVERVTGMAESDWSLLVPALISVLGNLEDGAQLLAVQELSKTNDDIEFSAVLSGFNDIAKAIGNIVLQLGVSQKFAYSFFLFAEKIDGRCLKLVEKLMLERPNEDKGYELLEKLEEALRKVGGSGPLHTALELMCEHSYTEATENREFNAPGLIQYAYLESYLATFRAGKPTGIDKRG